VPANENARLLPGASCVAGCGYASACWFNAASLGIGAPLDPDRFIRIASVGQTIGGMSLTTFNAALARHIETHPTLRQVPSTVNGHDTKELLNSGDPLCAALRAFAVEQIGAYTQSLPADPDHPLTAGQPLWNAPVLQPQSRAAT